MSDPARVEKLVNIYIYIRWPTVVEGDSKALFSVATTPRCREGRYYLDCSPYPWSIPYNAVLSRKASYHFLSV